jgi:hypothetical protein
MWAMRALLRVLVPLLGLGLAVVGVLLIIEVVAAWLQPPTDGAVVPWPAWRTVLEELSWRHVPVPQIAAGVAVVGLVLVLVGLLARRSDVALDGPRPEITATTSPRVLAQLVGRRVRATEDVAAASVTASRRRISVSAQAWGDADPEVREHVLAGVDELLDQLPLHRRPHVSVSVTRRKGPR